MFARVALRPVCVAVWLIAAACAGPPAEQRASLCEDLGNLAETVSLLATPPPDATVGDVRGAVEKLDPTIAQIEDADVVPEAERVGFRTAHEEALEALEGTGDDSAFVDVPAYPVERVADLVARYRAVVVSLGCERFEG